MSVNTSTGNLIVEVAGTVTTTGGGGGGGAVTVADGADVTQGTTTDAAYSSGSGTVVSVLKGIFTTLKAALTVIPGNAPGTKAAPATASVTTTAASIVSAGTRKAVLISNNGSNAIYLGKDNTTTASNGIQIAAGSVFVDDLTNDAWFALTSTGTSTVGITTVS